MQRKSIKAHIENECPLRVVIPPNGALPITANDETSIVPVSFTMLLSEALGERAALV